MLSFFPTPYPDELWYSVLCRYHLRSGNPAPTTTIVELFHGKLFAQIYSLFPNDTIYEIISQLPTDFLDIYDISLDHTLFKYAYRFRKEDEKIKKLKQIREGKSKFPTRICQNKRQLPILKSCPFCVKEDIDTYGESYWHVSHQLPLSYICMKHKCRLNVLYSKTRKELDTKFILPEMNNSDVNYNYTPTELLLSTISSDYLSLPMEISPPEEINNLYIGLVNNGYGIIRKEVDFKMNAMKITHDMCKIFGSRMVEDYFLTQKMEKHKYNKLRHWEYKSPERYVMIAALINQPANVTFSNQSIGITVYEKFLEFSKSSAKLSKEYIAEQLGVTKNHLNIMAYNINVKPFWIKADENHKTKNHQIVFSVTEEDKKRIYAYTKTHGYVFCSNFLLYCVNEIMKRDEIENANNITYVLSKRHNKIHLPNCICLNQISEENKTYTSFPIQKLIEHGNKPCSKCIS